MSLYDQKFTNDEKDSLRTEIIVATMSDYRLKTRPKDSSLATHLEAYTKDTLLTLADENSIHVRKSWNKSEMIAVMLEQILNTLEERLLVLGERKLQLFHQIAHATYGQENVSMEELEFYVSAYPQAVQMGMMYSHQKDDRVKSFIPEEMVEKIEEMVADYARFEEKHAKMLQSWDLLEKLMTIGVNLYGVMSLSRVYDLYDVYKETEKPSVKEKMAFLTEGYKYLPLLVIKNGLYKVNTSVIGHSHYVSPLHVSDTYEYVKDKMGTDFYLPTKKEMDYYLKHTFNRQNLHYKRMRQLVTKHSDTPHYAMDILETAILLGESFSVILDMLSENGVMLFDNQDVLTDFVHLYQGLNNSTRLWENAGYTPNELGGRSDNILEQDLIPTSHLPGNVIPLHAPQQPMRVEKVGRNDPCPCGSGKKYKKCHWLKDR